MALSDLKNAASGGEFSRLMLAFKCLMAAGTEMPSLIFDEIDTGISGEVAMRVGKLIRRMAERHQVLVITHSAQMASRAEAHWKVEKKQENGITQTCVRRLLSEESTAEIASMISGSAPGKAALEAAMELINH
jgi:DNA repair protein RecN (Recombination protein N)